MDFVLGFPRTQRGNNLVFVIVDRFSKWHISFHATKLMMLSVLQIFFFKEVVRLHGLPRSIVSDRVTKFVGYFWRTLWKKLRIELKFSCINHM